MVSFCYKCDVLGACVNISHFFPAWMVFITIICTYLLTALLHVSMQKNVSN